MFIGNTGSALHICNYIPQGGIPTGLTSFNFNYMAGNTYGVYLEPFERTIIIIGSFRVNATNNWWGTNNNPQNNPTNIAGDVNNVLANTWIVFTLSANPNVISYGGTSQIIGDMSHNNLGQNISNIGHIQDGIPYILHQIIVILKWSIDGTATIYTLTGVSKTYFNCRSRTGIANISAFIFGFLTPVTIQVMINAVNPPVNQIINVVISHAFIPKNDPTIWINRNEEIREFH